MNCLDVMQQALDALEHLPEMRGIEEAIKALRLAIEQAERQEPVGWITKAGLEVDRTTLFGGKSIAWRIPVYTAPPPVVTDLHDLNVMLKEALASAPPQRQPLTDEEAWQIFEQARAGSVKPVGVLRGIRAIERKHGIGGEA